MKRLIILLCYTLSISAYASTLFLTGAEYTSSTVISYTYDGDWTELANPADNSCHDNGSGFCYGQVTACGDTACSLKAYGSSRGESFPPSLGAEAIRQLFQSCCQAGHVDIAPANIGNFHYLCFVFGNGNNIGRIDSCKPAMFAPPDVSCSYAGNLDVEFHDVGTRLLIAGRTSSAVIGFTCTGPTTVTVTPDSSVDDIGRTIFATDGERQLVGDITLTYNGHVTPLTSAGTSDFVQAGAQQMRFGVNLHAPSGWRIPQAINKTIVLTIAWQ